MFFSCGTATKKEQTTKGKHQVIPKTTTLKSVSFNADSAYHYIQTQVDFGFRVPNTAAHRKCAKYLEEKLTSFGWNTIVQKATVQSFRKENLKIFNIIGQYNPDMKKRILLFAHWDSRPFADQDEKNINLPIEGANDGGSGVGILLEIARQVTISQPEIGIDIIFFDAEDYGEPDSMMSTGKPDTWCLGSQYWSKNMHRPNYQPLYGILLDMVGGKDAKFIREGVSMYYAKNVVDKVWERAAKLGYQNYFINQSFEGFSITDDHLYVNKIANIPSIDIIHYDASTRSFHEAWHTHKDNMEIIDRQTLSAVGETVLSVIINEK